MVKYLFMIGLLFSGAFAHGHSAEHLHFFSSLHVEYFVLFIVGLIGAIFVYEKVFKDSN